MSEDTKAPRPREVATRLAGKVLMPIVATAASAAAGYAAKKAPDLLQEKVLPGLKKAKDGAGGAAGSLPGQARSVAGGAGDLASGLADRAKAVAGGALPWGDDEGATANGATSRGDRSLSNKELVERRAERAQHRAQRRQKRSRT
jgi:hypothetical protein